MTTFTPSNNSAANNSATRTSVNEPSHKTAYEHLRSVLLRGGRMTKWKGVAASCAPMMGGVSPTALTLALATATAVPMIAVTTSSALAGTCIETGAGTGIWLCSGSAGADTTHSPTPAPGGALTVTTDGTFGIDTTGTGGSAIRLFNSIGDTDIEFIDINASDITGGDKGIDARNNGTGALSITTTGDVMGIGRNGIKASNWITATSVTINAANVTGSTIGIFATSRGTGGLTINTTGTVTGGTSGIYAGNREAGALIITTRGDVTGHAFSGISASQSGTGVFSINATGTVTSKEKDGIVAKNWNGIEGTEITTSNVIGFQSGIDARNREDALSITTNGAVIGESRNGIFAVNYSQIVLRSHPNNNPTTAFTTTDTEIKTYGDVSGEQNGIFAAHGGLGALVVTMDGSVNGETYGVLNDSYTHIGSMETYEASAVTQGGTFTITQSGTLNGGTAAFFDDAEGDNTNNGEGAASTLNIYGGLLNDARMNQGADAINVFEGATLLNTPILDGGFEEGLDTTTPELAAKNADNDTLTFDGWDDTIAGEQIVNFETVQLSDAADVLFTGAELRNRDSDGTTAPADGPLLFQTDEDTFARFANSFNIVGDVNNFGTLDLTPDAAVGTILSITGNYAAASSLIIDTELNDGGPDNVPANDAASTDQMIIAGNVSGVTDVTVRNRGGAGALTDLNGNGMVDANEGILIVQVQGDAPDDDAGTIALANHFVIAGDSDGAFVSPLTSRTNVAAGAFAYDIYAIGDGVSDNGENDYVLASTVIPLFQPAAPVYEAYPQTLLGMMTLPTMQQRVGNRYWKEAGPAPVQQTVYCKDPAMNFECAVNNEQADYYADKAKEQARMDDGAIWARVEAAHNHVEPTTSTTGASFDQDQWRLQAGIDGLAHESEKGDRLFVGINGSYGTASSQISSAFGSGSIDTTAYSLGATATWLATNGIYVDLQGSYAWFDSDLSSDIADIGSLADGNDGTGYALSAEFGKKIDVHNNWTFTPQVQLSYAAVDFDSFTGPSGEAVSLGDADSLKLRLGISADRDASWTDDNGMKQRSHLYAIANVIHDFSPETTVLVSGTPLTSERDAWTGEVGLGFTRNFNDDKYSVYGEVNAATGLENFGDSYKLGGTLGVRVSF